MSRDLIRQGLIKRGFPAHVADGILGNIDVESGFNPGINEIAPVVPGSRGGFGLFQHTGPRRRALEAFAAENNRPLADIDTQLDFMAQELLTTERRAGEALAGAKTTEDAARIFSERFLRPGIPHLDRRIASATGGTVSRNATQPEPLLGGQQMAEQPQQRGLRGLLSDPDKRDRLILALEGMTLNPNTALQQAAAQGLQERGQQRQQQAQAGRTADFLRARGRADLADAVEAGLPAADALRTALSPAPDDRTALIKNYEFAVEQGFEGSLTDFQNATKTGTNITVNTGAETSRFGPAPEGTVWVLDEQGDNVMETDPVSGKPRPVSVPLSGSAAEKRAAELAKAGGVNEAAAERASDSIRLIDSIIDDPALPSITGMIQGRIAPLTPAGTDLNVKVDQLKGQAFLQAFETLKGGGQITEREGIAAQNAIARLNRAQSTEAFQAALQELKEIAGRGLKRARGEKVSEPGQVTNATGNIAVDPELLQFMTPEERALFE